MSLQETETALTNIHMCLYMSECMPACGNMFETVWEFGKVLELSSHGCSRSLLGSRSFAKNTAAPFVQVAGSGEGFGAAWLGLQMPGKSHRAACSSFEPGQAGIDST